MKNIFSAGEVNERLSDVNYGRYIKYAPKEVKEIWQKLHSLSGDDRCVLEALMSRMEDIITGCLDDLCESLEEVSPAGSLCLLPGELLSEVEYIYPKGDGYFLVDRVAWLIAVFGNGEDRGKFCAHKVYDKYLRWACSYFLKIQINSLLQVENYEMSQGVHAERLIMSRLLPMETRIPWVVNEICGQIGNWVNENMSCMSGILGAGVMEKIAKNIDIANSASGTNVENIGCRSIGKMLVKDIPSETLDLFTQDKKLINKRNVESALIGESPTTFPLVKVDGCVRVVNRYAWLQFRDDSFFRVVIGRSSSNSKGDVFEYATTAMLNKCGPRGMEWQSSVELKDPKRGGKGDEIDTFCHLSGVSFVGECKANLLSGSDESVSANFYSTVLERALSQLDVRCRHLTEGWRVNGDGGGEVVGFITTFSSYGGMLWRSTDLSSDSGSTIYSVIPLYSLVLISSVMKTALELKEYLNFRVDLLSRGLEHFDELEVILCFIKRKEITLPDGHEGLIMLRPYELDGQAKLFAPEFNSGNRWKDGFKNIILQHSKPAD